MTLLELESPMAHRHLVLAYVVTWAGQLGYLAWVLVRWRRARSK